MSIWVKICGNTSLEDALLAAESGADAVGFVFAPSPRQVTLGQVAAITSGLPGTLEKIGVFVESTFDQVEMAVHSCGLTGVQLQFDAGSDRTALLRERLGPDVRILRVLHYGVDFAQRANGVAKDINIDAVLLDSRTAAAAGGTGIAFDWNSASASLSESGGLSQRMVVAGGLSPGNVAEAVRILNPWGVDVVSGVEAAPGRKDPEKVRAFIANARSAASFARKL